MFKQLNQGGMCRSSSDEERETCDIKRTLGKAATWMIEQEMEG
jgi:hypothetical protein